MNKLVAFIKSLGIFALAKYEEIVDAENKVEEKTTILLIRVPPETHEEFKPRIDEMHRAIQGRFDITGILFKIVDLPQGINPSYTEEQRILSIMDKN